MRCGRSACAVDRDGERIADLEHPGVAESPETFDQHGCRHTLDRVEVDRRPKRHGVVPRLENDLAANTKRCTLAAFHQPLFFSSEDVGWTEEDQVKRLWNRLYAADADLVLNGQQHQYERLTPMTPAGVVDTVRGLRSIDVGTGGESTALPVAIHPNSEVISDAFGVLKLTLYADRYSWEFVPLQGEAFTDRGTGSCH